MFILLLLSFIIICVDVFVLVCALNGQFDECESEHVEEVIKTRVCSVESDGKE